MPANSAIRPAAPDRSDTGLRRPIDDRVVVGVCAAIAGATGLSPLLVRVIALVVAAVVPPFALIAYAGLAVAIPRVDGRQLLGGDPPDTRETAMGAALVVAALIAFAAGVDHSLVARPGGVILLVGGLLLLAVHTRRRTAPPAGTSTPTQPVAPRAHTPAPAGRRQFDLPYPGPPARVSAVVDEALSTVELAQPAPTLTGPREPSITLYAAGGLIALIALASMLASLGVVDVTGGVIAVALGAVAIVLAGAAIVLAKRRGAGALVVLAVLAALGSVGAAVVGDHPRYGIGERTDTVFSAADLAAEHRFGIGRYTVDLTNLELATDTSSVRARLGFGDLVVRVPAGVRVTSVGTTRLENLAAVNLLPRAAGAPTLDIDANVEHGTARVEAVGR